MPITASIVFLFLQPNPKPPMRKRGALKINVMRSPHGLLRRTVPKLDGRHPAR